MLDRQTVPNLHQKSVVGIFCMIRFLQRILLLLSSPFERGQEISTHLSPTPALLKFSAPERSQRRTHLIHTLIGKASSAGVS